MRHPRKYHKALNITYSFTVIILNDLPRIFSDTMQYILELSMAVAGLLMFGDKVRDEVTSNIFRTKGYPKALSVCIVIFIAIIPLTKIPLKYDPARVNVP